jgi:hypothetical protein
MSHTDEMELMKEAQDFLNNRGVNIPLNLITRAYQIKFKSPPKETVEIGSRVFRVLDPQDTISAETQLLAVLEDNQNQNMAKTRNALRKVPEKLHSRYPDIFESVEVGASIVDKLISFKDGEEDPLQEIWDKAEGTIEYNEVCQSLMELINEAKDSLLSTTDPIPLILYIASQRQVSGEPITILTRWTDFKEDLQKLREYVGSELGKLR